MRSKKEIREEIARLKALEAQAAEDIEEAINEGSKCLDIYIQIANAFQDKRITLEWVLNEKGAATVRSGWIVKQENITRDKQAPL